MGWLAGPSFELWLSKYFMVYPRFRPGQPMSATRVPRGDAEGVGGGSGGWRDGWMAFRVVYDLRAALSA